MLCLFWVRTLAGWCIVWAETGYFFQSATLYAHFSESKRGKMFYVWLILDCFGLKQEIFFKVQLYSLTFRNRKSGALKSVKQKIFAAQTPQRKRGYVEDFALNSNFAPQLPLQA